MKTCLDVTETRTAEHSTLHIARRNMSISTMAAPDQGDGDFAAVYPDGGQHSGARPFRTALPEASRPGDPAPIWLSVLCAISCEAQKNGETRSVPWKLVSGRALYTNSSRDAERIEPLGVSLLAGHTMAVYWMPGDTAYTVEVYRHRELCA